MSKNFGRRMCCVMLSVLIGSTKVGISQDIGSPPIQITTDDAEARPNDVYPPRLLYQTIDGQRILVLYFGGWYRTDPETLPNDSIYRAVCSSPIRCGDAQKVIDPVAQGMGSASMVNDPAIVELHNNGLDYLVMYMTGVTGDNRDNGATVGNNKIYYSLSWADDGINWTVPQLLIDCAWMLTVTLDADDNVILYANTNWNNNSIFLMRYNLGLSGIYVQQPEAVSTAPNINPEVNYRPELGLYQIFAQRVTDGFDSEIDYLDSVDGLNWELRAENIIPPGMTPSPHPDTSCWVYYGDAPQIYLSNIFLKRWC